ncbi:MAG: glycosyltransferase family 39 protein [Patescibacteria group bacterium]
MTFLGDEGRDAIIVRNLLVNFDPILIGPGTSVGSMYLGPLYYYFMAPFLFLSNFSPVGPAVGVALLGVATIYLVYLVGFKWFSKKAGLVSAALFAISPTVITFSHSSWNPNIMPFFALLSVYSIWKVWNNPPKGEVKNYRWLIVTAITFAFVLNSHYLGIFLFPVLLLYWFLSKPKTYIQYTIYSILVFLFLMSPLLIFDLHHDFLNSKAFYKFLTVRQETSISSPVSSISKIYPTFEQINSSLLVAKQEPVGKIVTIQIVIMVIWLIVKRKKTIQPFNNLTILLIWLISGLLGLGIYNQTIHDHYFGFLFPAPFLLVGFLLSKIYDSKYKILAVLIFVFLVILNLKSNPLTKNPNNQMQRAKNVSEKVLEIAEGKPFDLAVLAERNYEDGYRYFMEVAGAQVMHADRWDQKTIVDNLIVICEKPKKECDPTHSPKAEVANFGMSKIDSDFEVDGVIIYKLIHNYPN